MQVVRIEIVIEIVKMHAFCYNEGGDCMECKQIERLIPAFLQNELKGRQLNRFLKHIDICPDCKEELTIHYLASEGILRLEEGKTFDLDRELQEYIQQIDRKRHRRKVLAFSIILFEISAVSIILLIFGYAFL